MKRQPARVLHLINGRGIGGAERLLLDMAARFDHDRIEAHVANTFFDRGDFVDELSSRNIDHSIHPARHLVDVPRLVRDLRSFVQDRRFDIVHTHLLHSTISGHLAASLAGSVRIVNTRHYTGEAWVGKPRLLAMMDRRAVRRADHVIAVSGAVAEHLVSCGVRRERISIIHNGIDVDAFAVTRNATAGPLTIGSVGSLTWRKGHGTLIEALAKMRAPATLRIIGEGPERGRLESLVASLGLNDRVTLPGFCSDVRGELAKIDVYVQPSLEEPFGISVLEAMASRLPVIATRTGGLPEIIEHERSGLLVGPGDVVALANAMDRLATDSALQRTLADEGQSRVEREFHVDQTTRCYEELYERLLRERP
jgi:glycosyltransferase involved in cell wall biosynthesis